MSSETDLPTSLPSDENEAKSQLINKHASTLKSWVKQLDIKVKRQNKQNYIKAIIDHYKKRNNPATEIHILS